MTVQAMPWAIQGQSHPAENARNLVAAMFGAPAAALVEGISITTAGGAHGIVGAGDLAVTQNGGGNMSVNVAAGRAIIRSTEAASLAAGAYAFLNDATVNVTIAAADPTNPRIDLIIAQVRDSNYSGANTDARLAAVTGTPAGSPVTPTVPDSCVVLAQVAVAALASSVLTANITDKRTRAYALGGHAACTSTTRPTGVSLYNGLWIDETDTFRTLRYDGTGFISMSEPDQTDGSPAFTGVTIGNGVWTSAKYHRNDGWCDIIYIFTLGTTSAVTGSITFNLPIAAATNSIAYNQLNVSYLDSSAGQVVIGVAGGSTTDPTLYALNTASTYGGMTLLSSTIPFTWATSDQIVITGRYPMTTRYS